MEREKIVKKIFLGLGVDVIGIASVDRFSNAPHGFHPKDIYKDCNSVIVFGKRMPVGSMLVSPRLLYLQTMIHLIECVDNIALQTSIKLQEIGGVGVPIPTDDPYEFWDVEKQEGRGLLSLKHSAELAGLGKIGKNTLLLNKKFGNTLVLGSVLTNMVLKPDTQETEEICLPGCKMCIDNCPQKALDGTTIDQKKCRQIIYSKNEKGFMVCNCNKCRIICPYAFGVPAR